MDWNDQLLKFALHAAVAAAAVLALLSRPGRRLASAGIARLAALPRSRFLLLAIVLTALVRGAVLPTVQPYYHSDTKEYIEKARLVADEGHPRSQEIRGDWEGAGHFYRTLGYPLPLAGWFKVTGWRTVRSAQVFNLLVACITVWLVLLLGEAVVGAAAARLGALGVALHLPHLMFTLIPYAETWATFTMVAAALAYAVLRRRLESNGGSCVPGILLGLALGLLCITRTEFLWLPGVALVLLAVEFRGSLLRLALPAAFVVVGALIPFGVNHEMRDGYPGTLRTSVQGGRILYFGNNPIEVIGHGNATREVHEKVMDLYNQDRTGGVARDAALEWMKANPLAVIGNMPKKLYFLWVSAPEGFGWRVWLDAKKNPRGIHRGVLRIARSIAWVESLLLLGLGVIGLWWAARGRAKSRPGWWPTALWSTTIVLHAGMFALLAPVPRNRYPLEPFLWLAAAAWVVWRVSRDAPREQAQP